MNLVHAHAYLGKAGDSRSTTEEPGEPASGSGKQTSKKRALEPWILQDSAPEDVCAEKLWTKVLADKDKQTLKMWLRSRLGVCLESLADTLPTYTEKDLTVVHRANK